MAIRHTFLVRDGETDTRDLTPLQAIKQKCLECSNWSAHEVSLCPADDCALYVFRKGKAGKLNLTDEQRKALSDRFEKVRKKIGDKKSIKF